MRASAVRPGSKPAGLPVRKAFIQDDVDGGAHDKDGHGQLCRRHPRPRPPLGEEEDGMTAPVSGANGKSR